MCGMKHQGLETETAPAITPRAAGPCSPRYLTMMLAPSENLVDECVRTRVMRWDGQGNKRKSKLA